jgi:very-short-patch-repair endonuclease
MGNAQTPVPAVQLKRARAIRRAMTPAELRLWNQLRAHRLMGLGFRRQHPLGPFIVDFACPAARVIVEMDGSQHACDEAEAMDARRTAWLESEGWQVLRFWNDDVLKSLDDVCQHIWMACDGRW